MTPSESEKLLQQSIEKLKAEIAESEEKVETLKFDLAAKKSRLKKLEKAIESADGDPQ